MFLHQVETEEDVAFIEEVKTERVVLHIPCSACQLDLDFNGLNNCIALCMCNPIQVVLAFIIFREI